MQIKLYLLIPLLLCAATNPAQALFSTLPTFSIMLDPAGDAMHPGRKLPDSFEHGITMSYAQELKKNLEQTYSDIRVIITRSADEVMQPLQTANFANRLAVDLVISLHCYQEQGTKPQISMYLFSYGQDYLRAPHDLALCRYDQAYLCSHIKTTEWANALYQQLNQENYKRFFEAHKPCKLPFKPLIGIKAPAFGLEISIKNRDDWQTFVQPVAAALKPIIEQSRGRAS
jgi:N-acetylmuramoyl-L-alanine amidase